MNIIQWIVVAFGVLLLSGANCTESGSGPGCVYYVDGEAIRFTGNSKYVEAASKLATELGADEQVNTVTIERGLKGYWLDLEIGNGVVSAMLDTGSSDLIIMGDSKTCPDCTVAANGGVYKPSSEAIDTSEQYEAIYGDGLHFGTAKIFKDKHGLACGDPEAPIDASFGVLKKATNELNTLGLAYSRLAHTTPFFDHLVDKHSFSNIFSMALCGEKKGSAIVLGAGLDDLSGKGWRYTSIMEEAYYTVAAQNFYVYDWKQTKRGRWEKRPGAKTLLGSFPFFHATKSGGIGTRTIVDSGSTLTYLPNDVFIKLKSLLRKIGRAQGISPSFWEAPEKGHISLQTISSQQLSHFPSMGISFRAETGKDFVLRMPHTHYIKHSGALHSYYAFAPAGDDAVILGMNFMENFVVRFDRHNKRIGFVPNTGYCKN